MPRDATDCGQQTTGSEVKKGLFLLSYTSIAGPGLEPGSPLFREGTGVEPVQPKATFSKRTNRITQLVWAWVH